MPRTCCLQLLIHLYLEYAVVKNYKKRIIWKHQRIEYTNVYDAKIFAKPYGLWQREISDIYEINIMLNQFLRPYLS